MNKLLSNISIKKIFITSSLILLFVFMNLILVKPTHGSEEDGWGLFNKRTNSDQFSRGYFSNHPTWGTFEGDFEDWKKLRYVVPSIDGYAFDPRAFLSKAQEAEISGLYNNENKFIHLTDWNKQQLINYLKTNLENADNSTGADSDHLKTGWRFIMYNIARIYSSKSGDPSPNPNLYDILTFDKNNPGLSYDSGDGQEVYNLMEQEINKQRITVQYTKEIDHLYSPFNHNQDCPKHYEDGVYVGNRCNLIRNGLKFNTGYAAYRNDIYKYNETRPKSDLLIVFWDALNRPVTVIKAKCANPIGNLYKEAPVSVGALITSRCDGVKKNLCKFNKNDTSEHEIKFEYKITAQGFPHNNGSLNSSICYDLYKNQPHLLVNKPLNIGETSWGGPSSCINNYDGGIHKQVKRSNDHRIGSVIANTAYWAQFYGQPTFSMTGSEIIKFKPSEIATDNHFAHDSNGHQICRVIDYGPGTNFNYLPQTYLEKANSDVSNKSEEVCVRVELSGGNEPSPDENKLWLSPVSSYLLTGEPIESHNGIGLESFAQRTEQWSYQNDSAHRNTKSNRNYYWYVYSDNNCPSKHYSPSSGPSVTSVQNAQKSWCQNICKNDDNKTKCQVSYDWSGTSSTNGSTYCYSSTSYAPSTNSCPGAYSSLASCLAHHPNCKSCSSSTYDYYTRYNKSLNNIRCTYWRRQPNMRWWLSYFVINPSANADADYSKPATTSPTSASGQAYYQASVSGNNKPNTFGILASGISNFGKGKDKNDDFEIVRTLVTPTTPRAGFDLNTIDNINKKGFATVKRLMDNLEPGSQICFGLSATPWQYRSASGGQAPRETRTADNLYMHAKAICTTTTKQPLAEVTSNSLYANKILTERNNRVNNNWSSLINQNSGSFVEYAAIAKAQVDNMFRSNGYIDYNNNNILESLHSLTFGNQSTLDLGKVNFSTNNPVNLGIGLVNAYNKNHNAFANFKFITDTTYEINSNIIANNPTSVADYKPNVIVMNRPNSVLTINKNVNRIDAWIIVNGKILTCGASSDASACNRQLIINGPVLTNKIELRRTYGGGINGVTDELRRPAEVFNMRPIDYIWVQRQNADSSQIHTVFLRDLPPRY